MSISCSVPQEGVNSKLNYWYESTFSCNNPKGNTCTVGVDLSTVYYDNLFFYKSGTNEQPCTVRKYVENVTKTAYFTCPANTSILLKAATQSETVGAKFFYAFNYSEGARYFMKIKHSIIYLISVPARSFAKINAISGASLIESKGYPASECPALTTNYGLANTRPVGRACTYSVVVEPTIDTYIDPDTSHTSYNYSYNVGVSWKW
ncbi:MAG: hypothetical protein KBD78_12105 [Oligoflexales bacterium]|nr:hypothetical protein [Oligoflexales bacterium]